MITEDQINTLYPRASLAHRQAFVNQSPVLFKKYGIDQNGDRLHYFLAQIGFESDGLVAAQENLNYQASRLLQVWPRRFANLAATHGYAKNPQALANLVYANRLGNGDAASGDGWRYRGQGYIQITGRGNYDKVGQEVGLDLLNQPELVQQPEHALRVVCGYWGLNNLNVWADKKNFKELTRRINGGYHGLAQRQTWLAKVEQLVPFGAAG